ncbi:MAG TPA: hypothetical protein VFC19_21310 [Candidatus Limnocylindrales bacterium]|nr:hypothetical protein [Candidatus Limnocylindrales bacterium]
MSHEGFADLEFTGWPDVASARLSKLLAEDPTLDKAVQDLVAQLLEPPEVTSRWKELTTGSCDPNSTC